MALVNGHDQDGNPIQYDDGLGERTPMATFKELYPDPNSWERYVGDRNNDTIPSELLGLMGTKTFDAIQAAGVPPEQIYQALQQAQPSGGWGNTHGSVALNTALSKLSQVTGKDMSQYQQKPGSQEWVNNDQALQNLATQNWMVHDGPATKDTLWQDVGGLVLKTALLAAGGYGLAGGVGAGADVAGGVGLGADGAVGVGGEGLAGLGGYGEAAGGLDLGNFANLLNNPANVSVAGDATGIGTLGEGAGGYLNTGITSLTPGAATGGLQLTGGNAALGLNATPGAVEAFNAGLSPSLAAAAGVPGAAALSGISNTAAAGAGLSSGANAAGSFLTGNGGATTLSNLATGGVGGPATAAAAGAAGSGSAISRVLDGTATSDDYLSLLGKAIPGLIGAYGANQQSGALSDLASQFAAYGAPSRARYEASMTPGFDPTTIPGYKGALDTSADAITRKLSASGGNPYGNPGALIEANKAIVNGTALPAVQEYQRLNAGSGGLAQLAAAYPGAATSATNSNTNVYNGLGAAAADVFNPQDTTLSALLKKLTSSGAFSLA